MKKKPLILRDEHYFIDANMKQDNNKNFHGILKNGNDILKIGKFGIKAYAIYIIISLIILITIIAVFLIVGIRESHGLRNFIESINYGKYDNLEVKIQCFNKENMSMIFIDSEKAYYFKQLFPSGNCKLIKNH
jgi:hypothetical protein